MYSKFTPGHRYLYLKLFHHSISMVILLDLSIINISHNLSNLKYFSFDAYNAALMVHSKISLNPKCQIDEFKV